MAKKTYMLLCPSAKLVKIGCSDDPVRRMLNLRTMNAAETEPLVILDVPERELHEKFSSHRDHGEWFRVCPAISGYLFTIREPSAGNRLASLIESPICLLETPNE